MNKKKVIEKLFPVSFAHQLLLFAIPFFLFLQTYWFDYTYHDDDSIVLYNAKTLEQFNLEKIFFTDAWMMDKRIELYRPFQSFTYAVDYFFSGTNASGYHLHNVLIFCFGIQLFYLLMLSLLLSERTAFFLSMIMSVHFLFAHTVSWIPARGDLYLFVFSVSSMLLFYLFLKKQKISYCLSAAVSFFFALLSKESAVVLLPILYITAYLFWKPDWKKINFWLLLLLSIPLFGIYWWMRQQSISPIVNIFSIEGIRYNLPIIPESVFKFFVPVNFSVMPAFSLPATVGGCILIVMLAVAIYIFRNKINRSLVFAGVVFFLLPVLPSVIYKPAFSGFAYDYLDHRMFFPSIGLLLIAYSIFIGIIEKQISVNVLYALIAVMSIITFINSANYKNYESYYENATSTNLKSGLAHSNYGASLARENKYDQALIHFKKSIKLSPDVIDVRMKLADSYLHLKDYANMIEQCNAVIKINPKFPKSYYNIALYNLEKKKFDTAEFYVSKAVTADSLNAEAFLFSGLIAEGINKPDAALHDFKRAVTLNANLALAYFRMGYIHGNKSLFKEALADFINYVNLNPNDGNGYFYRGQAYCMNGNTAQGCLDLHAAETMGVTEARAKINYWCK